MPASMLAKAPEVDNKRLPPVKGERPSNAREVSPPDINRSLGNSYLQSVAGNREVSEQFGVQRYLGNGSTQPGTRLPLTGEEGRFKKSSTEPTAGGITGLTLDVTFTVSNTPAAGLQVIQTFWGTTGTAPGDEIGGKRFGTMSFTENTKTYGAFVDGGKESPYVKWSGNPPAHATEPYYLTASEVTSNVKFTKDSGTVKVYDVPSAVGSLDEANFETAIVAVNHKSSGNDKVLKVFDWGWSGKGTTSNEGKGTEIAGKDSGLTVKSTYSPRFANIVKHDYPDYALP